MKDSINNPIIDNLPVWSGTPHGIKKLRELILELAVRGKLVPQDPNDDPASELLKRIAMEKEELVKAGKIKQQKVLPEILEREKPFELPGGWEWSLLGAITSYIQRGKGPKYSEKGKVRVISQKCVQWTGFNISPARCIDDSTIIKYPEERYLKDNDLLWNSTGTGTAGRIVILNELNKLKLVADSHVTVVRPLLCNSSFVLKYLSSPSIQFRTMPGVDRSLVSGTTNQVELSTSSVKTLGVPIPPLAEQHRIVAKVDELMALCDKLEAKQGEEERTHQQLVTSLLDCLTDSETSEVKSSNNKGDSAWSLILQHWHTLFTTPASIDALKQTILQLAVMGKLVPQDPNDEPASELLKKIATEKAKLIKEGKIKKQKQLVTFTGLDDLKKALPAAWAWIRLSDFSDIVRGGSPRPARDDRYYNGDIPFLKVADITNKKGKYVDGFNSTIKQEGLRKTRFIDRRTVLLSNSGATLGIPAICDFPTTFNDGIAAFINLSSEIHDEFLFLYLSSLSRWLLDIASRGQGQPNLNTDIIKAIWFPLPPLLEQHRIVAKVDELMALCDTLKSNLETGKTIQQQLATTIVSNITGSTTVTKEKMKAPKTKLISPVKLKKKPTKTKLDSAPLSALLFENKKQLEAKELWQLSGLEIDAFYQQLKMEVDAGWIAEPSGRKAHLQTVS